MQVNYLERATDIAQRSPHNRFKTGCVILTKSGRVYYGWSHPTNTNLVNFQSIHAEIHAIRRAGRRVLADSICYVATVNRHGKVTLSKPCPSCMALLEKCGVAAVYWTTPHTPRVFRRNY